MPIVRRPGDSRISRSPTNRPADNGDRRYAGVSERAPDHLSLKGGFGAGREMPVSRPSEPVYPDGGCAGNVMNVLRSPARPPQNGR
jgi:hypothetical protein